MIELDGLTWWAIDPHEHCRDEEQKRKATIAEVLCLALSQGVGIVYDMPNTERPVIDRYRVWERLALVPKGQENRYRLYVGLTDEVEQILEALWCYDNIPEVIGLKMFCGRSVGNLTVIEPDAQRMVYRILAEQGYTGPLALHCEDEQMMNAEIFKWDNPITHGWARPIEAEESSVYNQIMFALAERFKGKIHICHVSSPLSVILIQWAKGLSLRISCGVTPHHIMWDEGKMSGPDGLDYKMNPPLRPLEVVVMLRQMLCRGMIDVIETDQAAHTAEEKRPPQCLSGYPSLTLYRQFVTEFLPSLGLQAIQIKALTHDNVIRIFDKGGRQ